jgi:hypothetical protein
VRRKTMEIISRWSEIITTKFLRDVADVVQFVFLKPGRASFWVSVGLLLVIVSMVVNALTFKVDLAQILFDAGGEVLVVLAIARWAYPILRRLLGDEIDF